MQISDTASHLKTNLQDMAQRNEETAAALKVTHNIRPSSYNALSLEREKETNEH